jgi:hypothetical protein
MDLPAGSYGEKKIGRYPYKDIIAIRVFINLSSFQRLSQKIVSAV